RGRPVGRPPRPPRRRSASALGSDVRRRRGGPRGPPRTQNRSPLPRLSPLRTPSSAAPRAGIAPCAAILYTAGGCSPAKAKDPKDCKDHKDDKDDKDEA